MEHTPRVPGLTARLPCARPHCAARFRRRPGSTGGRAGGTTSCIAGLHRLTFDPADPTHQATSQEFFGTADLWGDTAPGATAP